MKEKKLFFVFTCLLLLFSSVQHQRRLIRVSVYQSPEGILPQCYVAVR